MKLLDNRGQTDPTLNLALEEYAVRNLDPDENILLFYINQPSIIVGKNQNTLEEINHDYVREQGIRVVRRISGGGAVYHDLGNLNFSFIQKYRQGAILKFHEFTKPVVAALNKLGVPAEVNGRNDILAGGRKISGNAQFFTAQKMFSHGTLLYNSELDAVTEALRVKMAKIESKGLKSVRSRVANIAEFLERVPTVEEFRDYLTQEIFAGSSEIPRYEFKPSEWQEIVALADSKYRTWDWNYGSSPPFNVQKQQRYDFGQIDARIEVKKGVIQSLKIYGDFFGEHEIAELEARFVGVRFDRDELAQVIADVEVGGWIAGMSGDTLLEFLY